MLDSGPLGAIAHPKAKPEITAWFQLHLARGTRFIISQVIDFELRRAFLHKGMVKSLRRLDELKASLEFMAVDDATWDKAAHLWADALRHGHCTSDDRELNIDVILAAQALQAGAAVVTTNPRHLSYWVVAKPWEDFQ